jgi:hypothetical protein
MSILEDIMNEYDGKEITQEQQDLKDEQESAKPKTAESKKETPKAPPPDKKK